MKKIACILFFAVNLLSVLGSVPDSVFKKLDEEIGRRQIYFDRKEDRIKRLKNEIIKAGDDWQRFAIYESLFKEYKSYQYESANEFAQLLGYTARRLGDHQAAVKAQCCQLFCLISAGLFKEAGEIIPSIDVGGANDSLKVLFYDTCVRYYSDLSSYNSSQPYYDKYMQNQRLYSDSAMMFLPAGSYEYKFISARKKLTTQSADKVIPDFLDIYHNYELGEHEKAIMASYLGLQYAIDGQQDKAIYYTALSAIHDIRAAVRETTSLKNLASYLYDKGDVKKASSFIYLALEDANFYDAKHRKLEINSILPIIENRSQYDLRMERNRLWFLVVAVSALLIAVSFGTVVIYRQKNKLSQAKGIIQSQYSALSSAYDKLKESFAINDQFVMQSLYGKSQYLDRVEGLLKKIDRKVRNRLYGDIQDICLDFDIKKQRENIYTEFDAAFLKLFPNFIDGYNALFASEDRISLDADGNLPPEVRIFALMRLGIKDNERISTILNYSVNTIYAYKTRIKNRTIVPKAEFEDRISDIKM